MNQYKKTKINNAKKEFSKIKLSEIQKNDMLSKIYTDSGYVPSEYSSQISPYAKFLKTKATAIAMVVFFVLSGTTFAAHNSLPGDLLYPVKTNIIEPTRLALTFDVEAKTDFQLELIETRIAEIEALEENGELTEEKAQQNRRHIAKNLDRLGDVDLSEQKTVGLELRIEIYNQAVADFENLKLPFERGVGRRGKPAEAGPKSDSEISTEIDIKIDSEIAPVIELEIDSEINLDIVDVGLDKVVPDIELNTDIPGLNNHPEKIIETELEKDVETETEAINELDLL